MGPVARGAGSCWAGSCWARRAGSNCFVPVRPRGFPTSRRIRDHASCDWDIKGTHNRVGSRGASSPLFLTRAPQFNPHSTPRVSFHERFCSLFVFMCFSWSYRNQKRFTILTLFKCAFRYHRRQPRSCTIVIVMSKMFIPPNGNSVPG